MSYYCYFFFFQVEDGIRGGHVTGVQTCALPILPAELLGAVLLAVAPLPQDRPEELGGYARGVLIALLRMGMTRQVADVKGRLQRMDPEDPAYGEAFTELVRLEERRRLLNESA